MSNLTFFRQKFCRGTTVLTFPLPTDFTVITDHPSMVEVSLGCCPQCGVPSVNIPNQFLGPGAA
jgi:hypothetical protein